MLHERAKERLLACTVLCLAKLKATAAYLCPWKDLVNPITSMEDTSSTALLSVKVYFLSLTIKYSIFILPLCG